MSPSARPWRGLAAFAALQRDWDRLAAEAELDPLCNAHAWTLAHARAFANERDVFGWSFEQGGETVAVLALRREPSRGALALRRALFLADGTFDSDYLEPPIRPGLEAEIARQVFAVALAERGLEALVFAGLPAGSRFLAALRGELDARGLPRREHAVDCLSAALPHSFERYVAELKPRMRSKLRSAVRAAEERGARLAWCEREDELEGFLEDLFRLHALRWRAEGRAGSFADPRRKELYRAVARTHLARGELCFARLVERDGVTAAQIGVRVGERYYQIQEGFDPARESERPGVALRALAVADLIGRGARAYDFMAGDSRHKRDWGGVLRPCVTVAFPLARWRARVAYGLRERIERWRGARKEAETEVEENPARPAEAVVRDQGPRSRISS